jgi:hypothetical protein
LRPATRKAENTPELPYASGSKRHVWLSPRDILTVITTGIMIFVALLFGFYIAPALLCSAAGGMQAALIRAVYGPPGQ